MKTAGQPSWSLSTSVDTTTHMALYIRDALGLDTSADPLSPPQLVHRPPDRRDLLSTEERARAAEQWPAWWQDILTFEAASQDPANRGDFMTWHTARAQERDRVVGNPPDFGALAGSPALRRGVAALFAEARGWRDHTVPPGSGGGPQIPWDVARAVADDVAVRRGVSPDDVRGLILALGVEGTWWRLLRPGVGVCATECFADAELSAVMLREVFESRLGAHPER